MRLKVILALVAALVLGTAPTATATPHTLGPLTGLVIDRILVGDEVAAAKFGTDKPIDDPVREQQLLGKVRADAVALGIDPAEAVQIFRDQIEASKVVQRGLFARWTAHPDEAPTTRPDLGEIRVKLDGLTTTIMAELDRTDRLRDLSLPCRTQLTLATVAGTVSRHLDAVHRRALTTAVPSVCAMH